MTLVTLDDDLDQLIQKVVEENKLDFPHKAHYLNQLVKKDLEKRGLM